MYDQKTSYIKFRAGDKVLVLLPTLGSNLETNWQGPYTTVYHQNHFEFFFRGPQAASNR